MFRAMLLALLCLPTVCGLALPSLSGPTGLAVLPTATRAADGGDLMLGVANGVGQQQLSARLVHNLAGGEVGICYARETVDLIGVSAKGIRLLPGGRARAALGGLLLHTPHVDTTAAYLAATRELAWGEVTGGVSWTRVASGGAASALRPYAGVRLPLPEGVALTAEYQAKGDGLFEAHPLTALTVTRAYGLATLTIGTTNAVGLLGAAEQRVFAGIALPFLPDRPW